MSSPVPAGRPLPRRAALTAGLALPLGLMIAGCSPDTTREAAHPARPASSTGPARPPRTARLTLPAPTGHLQLGTVSLHLVDPSRPDPWVPRDRVRQLMIQIWYPGQGVGRYPRAPYSTPATELAWGKSIGVPVPLNWPITHGHLSAPVLQREGGWPVVLYSHSLGGERFETTCLVEELVSLGYVVVTIDHIHDAAAVQLPDGRMESYAVPALTARTVSKEIIARVADVRFVLDQLAVISRGGNPDHEHRPLPHGLHRALDLGRVGMFGQSDGGSTTAHAIHADARIIAGVDLDGTLWTPQALDGSSGALLLFGRQKMDPLEAKTWAELWTRQRGPKLALNLLGSTHDTFTDMAALVPEAVPILGLPHSQVIKGVGTINGDRAIQVQRTYISAWFGKYLRGHSSSLLTGPSARYPEVQFRAMTPAAAGQ